jgi:CHAT domain-containing protein
MKMKLPDYDVLDELGLMYLETGNFNDAHDLIRKSFDYRQKRFSKTNLLRYRSHLAYGNYFYKTHQLDSAHYFLSEYIFYIRNSNHTAKEELNRYADTYQILSELEIERENYDLALKHAKKNRKWQHHRWTKKEAGRNNINKILSLNLVSACYRLKNDTAHAIKFSEEAFKLYNERIGADSHHLIPLLINKALICWNMGRYAEAEKNFMRATFIQSDFIKKNFSSLTEYEKENFYAALKKNFDYLNAFAIDKWKNDKVNSSDSLFSLVYNFQIATKAIILSESNRMLSILQNTTDEALKASFNEWRMHKNELAKKMIVQDFNEQDPEVKDLKSTINRLEKEMAQKTALFNHSESQIVWQDIQRKLKPGQSAVEIIRTPVYSDKLIPSRKKKEINKVKTLTDSVVYLVMIVKPDTRNAPEKLVLVNGKELETRAYKFYQNSNLLKVSDRFSYNYFWKPIEDKIGDSKDIFVSSDGVYNLINLALLQDDNGKRLIDKTNVVNVTNTKSVMEGRSEHFKVNNAILLGRPDYNGNDNQDTGAPTKEVHRSADDMFRNGVADLPGTEVEVKGIEQFFNKNKVKTQLLLKRDATEDELKNADSKDVIHIATHGYFDSRKSGRNPMVRSGLLLAGVTADNTGKKEDGILTAYEASNLDLKNTKLVVLSACETGLGEVKSGEGVYGLQRAFEVAGVDNILMSMWKVSDEATQELMIAFYDNLLSDKTVHEAFKAAQLKIRNKYPETFYWGAFKLVGY